MDKILVLNGVYLRFEAETNKQCQRENRDREMRGLAGFVTRLLEGPLKVFLVIGLRNWAQDERVGRIGRDIRS